MKHLGKKANVIFLSMSFDKSIFTCLCRLPARQIRPFPYAIDIINTVSTARSAGCPKSGRKKQQIASG